MKHTSCVSGNKSSPRNQFIGPKSLSRSGIWVFLRPNRPILSIPMRHHALAQKWQQIDYTFLDQIVLWKVPFSRFSKPIPLEEPLPANRRCPQEIDAPCGS